MTGEVPSASVTGGRLTVHLASGAEGRRADVEGVLDRNPRGEVVGVEILDLRSRLGGVQVPARSRDGYPRWSYGEEIDAFYVQVAEGPAPLQSTVLGTAVLDGDDVVLSLRIELPPDPGA